EPVVEGVGLGVLPVMTDVQVDEKTALAGVVEPVQIDTGLSQETDDLGDPRLADTKFPGQCDLMYRLRHGRQTPHQGRSGRTPPADLGGVRPPDHSGSISLLTSPVKNT